MMLHAIFYAILLLPASITTNAASEVKMSSENTLHAGWQTWFPDTCNHSGQFSQHRTSPKDSATMSSSGHFVFLCGAGLFWSMDKPLLEQWFYRSDQQSFRSEDGKKFISVSSRANRRFAQMLTALVGGEHAYIERHFLIRVLDEQTLNLVPKRKSMKKFIAAIVLIKGLKQAEINIALTNGEMIRIALDSFQAYENWAPANCPAEIPLNPVACTLILPNTTSQE